VVRLRRPPANGFEPSGLNHKSTTFQPDNRNLWVLKFAEWQAKAQSSEFRAIEKKLAERPKAQRPAEPTADETSCGQDGIRWSLRSISNQSEVARSE
jgi:hypothetical protein